MGMTFGGAMGEAMGWTWWDISPCTHIITFPEILIATCFSAYPVLNALQLEGHSILLASNMPFVLSKQYL